MAERTVYCEECVEEIPTSEVYWDDGRLYCRRCGSEVEPPDRDIFEEIVDNRSGFLFRDAPPDDLDEEEEEEEAEDLAGDGIERAGADDDPGAVDEAEPAEEAEAE
jgi:hypothetical protein